MDEWPLLLKLVKAMLKAKTWHVERDGEIKTVVGLRKCIDWKSPRRRQRARPVRRLTPRGQDQSHRPPHSFDGLCYAKCGWITLFEHSATPCLNTLKHIV